MKPSKTEPRGRSKTPNKSSVSMSRPKGKRNAYMLYSADVRENVKASLVARHKGVEENVTGKMVTAEVSKRYNKLNEKDFKHYQAMADQDEERWEQQTQDFEKKGFWMENGKKRLPGEVAKVAKKKSASASKSKSKSKKASKKKSDKKSNKKSASSSKEKKSK